MANKKQFPKDFTKKDQVNVNDKILGADAVSGDPYFIEVGEITKNKVDKENNKSLVLDSEITKLQGLPTKTQLDATINSGLNTKVDKVTGKQLSTNDYSNDEKAKVAKIKVEATGDSNKFLNEKGEYKEVIVPKAPVQSISVNGDDVAPDVDGNVAITIPDAPIQTIDVNGENVAPVDGKISIEIPKAPVQSVSVNNAVVEPDNSGNVNIDVNINVEQTINPASTDPVSSSAVASAFNELDSKYGTQLSLATVGEGDDKVYSISLLNENGDILSTTEEFAGGGGSGDVTTTKIVLTKLSQNSTIKKGDEVILQYQYDHIDTTTNVSTGNPAKITTKVTAGALSNTIESVVNAGTINNLDVSDLLQLGNNMITIRAEVNTGDRIQVSTITYTVLVVNLVLNSSLDIAQYYDKGTSIYVPFSLQGSGNKTLKTYVNNSLYETRTITQSTATGTILIPTSSYSHGNINVQIVAELDVVSSTILSNSIYYDLIIREANNSTPIVASRYNYLDGRIIEVNQRPSIVAKQFEDYTINYAVYDPSKPTKLVNVIVDGALISSANVGFTSQRVTNKSISAGEYVAKITTGNIEYLFNVSVSNSNINLSEPTDNMVFKFLASGRTNNDVNKDTWNSTNSPITATLSGVKYGGDGWLNNALKLSDNGRATINYNALNAGNAVVSNSFTYQIKFKTSDIVDDNSQLIRCLDADGTGFVITATQALMQTKGKATVSMKLAPNEVYNITFVSFPFVSPTSSDYEKINDSMLYLYINGIMSGGVQMSNSDSIYQAIPSNIILGGGGATLEVYSTRLYNRYLSDSEALDLYIVDLDNVNDIVSKYNANAIVDGNGEITVDNVAEDMRYLVITGVEANGVQTVLQAAINNNKKTKYNVTEILHIKKSEPQLNFKLVGGSIQLQGTSSLAYPIKNYKISLLNSQKQAGEFYLGCDAQGNGGVLQDKALFSFKVKSDSGKVPAPVNLWCLKADFAESSSSHNTGMARLVHNTLTSIGEKTPPQKAVPNDYKYDVRTTVDGEPCYLFYRATINDVPKFLGKFNMNNDKGTEDVFGFLNIPNYHVEADGVTPTQWIQNKFSGKNPSECWEFLNNDYPMGSYLDDDFDVKVDVDGKQIPNWTRVFEARFPDNQDTYADGTKKPYYLERFVKWVKATQTDTTKFKNELKDYADVKYLCDYYVLTDILGAVDQRVKNQMLAFWYDTEKDKMLAYFIFYDNDTILGVRNDGRLKYGFDIDENTIDTELSVGGNTVYAFAGHNSVLWNNLRTEFQTELQEAYQRIRTKMTNDYIFNMFDKEQSDKYVERTYNLDAQYKYVKPKTLGTDVNVGGTVSNLKYSYLESMQGSRKSHRHWWLTNRLNIFDAKYSTGQYTLTDLAWKGYSNAGATIKATANRDFYFQVRREGTVMTHAKVAKGVEWSYTYPNDANIGTIFHLYGGLYMSSLDMSEWGGFVDLNLPTLPVLYTLKLGGASGKTYPLTEIAVGNKLPMLKVLDIRNYTALPSIDLSSCTRLEQVNALGCNNLASISFADGAPLQLLVLPKNLKSLVLNSVAQLDNANIQFPEGSSLQVLSISNCPNIDWYQLYFANKTTITNIRVTGIDMKGDVEFLNQFKNIGGVDDKGNLVTTARLVGTYRLTQYYDDIAVLRTQFPELNIIQAEYSSVVYLRDVVATANIYNPENKTGYTTALPYAPSGHFKALLDKRHRYLGKLSDGTMNIAQLSDTNSNYYADGTTLATIDGTNGDVFIKEPSYWYKGITNHKEGKSIIYLSTNADKPKSQAIERKVITKNDLRNSGDWERIADRYLAKGYATINASLKQVNVSGNGSATDYGIYRVDVSGFNFIAFPMGYSASEFPQVSLFSDANDNVIDTVEIKNTETSMSNWWVDTVCQIPVGAKYLYVSGNSYYADTYIDAFSTPISLVKGDDISDVYDWNKFDECLLSAFPNSYNADNDPVIRSKKGGTYTASLLTLAEIETKINAKGAGFKLPKYGLLKHIQFLHLIAYGDRNFQTKFIYNVHDTKPNLLFSNYGASAPYGMKETNGENSDSPRYKLADGTFINTPISVAFGYEGLYENRLIVEHFMPFVYNGYTNSNYQALITDVEGGRRGVLGYYNDTKDLQIGRYVDMLPDTNNDRRQLLYSYSASYFQYPAYYAGDERHILGFASNNVENRVMSSSYIYTTNKNVTPRFAYYGNIAVVTPNNY